MKLKVCGMKYVDNINGVALLQPNYLGFIFWEPSKRYFTGSMPKVPVNIKKVGVFVDASLEEIIKRVQQYNLQAVQLHGKETPEYCKQLAVSLSVPQQSLEQVIGKEKKVKHKTVSTVHDPTDEKIEIIKVFSIKDSFDFGILEPYEKVCDYYLFDTKGKLPGGNGYAFNWEVLKNYPSAKPYFLSGGIGLEETEKILSFLQGKDSKYCHAIDVNSRFETEPGLKDIEKLKKFKELLTDNS